MSDLPGYPKVMDDLDGNRCSHSAIGRIRQWLKPRVSAKAQGDAGGLLILGPTKKEKEGAQKARKETEKEQQKSSEDNNGDGATRPRL